MRRALRFVTALLIALVIVTTTRGEDRGTIAGAVDKPAQTKSVTAIDRATDKKHAGKIDAKTGKFEIAELPLEARYDLLIDYGAARLEGVNLKVPRSDYEEEQPLTKADIADLKEKAKSLNQFEDKVEVLAVAGNIQHAAVVLNKLRTKPFVNSQPGEVIWRLEVWRFERPDETWVKVQDELFLVHYRERLQKSEFDKKALTLDPALGGLQPTKEKPTIDVGTIKLPAEKPGVRMREK
jgi:hypothetical protein